MKFLKFQITVVLLLTFFSCNKSTVILQNKNLKTIVQYPYYQDEAMWNHIFDSSNEYEIPKNIKPISILLPHHDITVTNQNKFYKALNSEISPSVVVIVSPDHFELGKELITMPKKINFDTPDGIIDLDYESIKKIASDSEIKNVVKLQNNLWQTEHGIFLHMPFLKHYFPNAKIIPITVKMLSTPDEFEYFDKLGKVLNTVLPEDSLFIASVDCSHYQIPDVAKFHDYVTYNTIINTEDPRFAEIDSPETVKVLYSFNKERNVQNSVLIDHSSTYDFIPDPFVETTTHFYLAFYNSLSDLNLAEFNIKAKENSQKIQTKNIKARTIMIAGSGKTNAHIRKTWTWDRYKNSKDKAEVLLRDAAGKEARFFYGFDELIFDPEIGTEYSRSLHNTNLFVKTITQSSFNKKEYQILEQKNSINVLEVVLENDNIPKEKDLISIFNLYDVIVFRDDNGIIPAVLYYKNKDKILKEDLGICAGKGNIQGKLAFINFSDDDIHLQTFEYQSQNGIIPAIHQFIPE